MDRVMPWLRDTVAKHKWIIWVALLIVALIAVEVGLSLLPHHVLNTLRQYEEKPNGIQNGR
jgi:hypothetical protein